MATTTDEDLVSVKVRRPTWRLAKIAAAEDETSITEIMERAVKEFVDRRKKTQKP